MACAYRYWSLLSVDQLEGSEPVKLFLLMSLQGHAMSIIMMAAAILQPDAPRLVSSFGEQPGQ